MLDVETKVGGQADKNGALEKKNRKKGVGWRQKIRPSFIRDVWLCGFVHGPTSRGGQAVGIGGSGGK